MAATSSSPTSRPGPRFKRQGAEALLKSSSPKAAPSSSLPTIRPIAAEAGRVVEISDGDDHLLTGATTKTAPPVQSAARRSSRSRAPREALEQDGEAFQMALRALSSHRLRTFLTVLGIIGIAYAWCTGGGAGAGQPETVLERISSIGNQHHQRHWPGASAADRRRDAIRTLVPARSPRP